MKSGLLLLFTACIFSMGSRAQTAEKKWNFGLHGGLAQYSGDRGENFYRTSQQATYGFAGVSVSRYLSKHFDALVFFTRGELGNNALGKYKNADPEQNHFLMRLNTAHLALRFNILPSNYVIRPYLYAGAGILFHEGIYSLDRESFDYALPSAGAGLNIRLTSIVSLQLEESFMFTTADHMDGKSEGANDNYLFHKAGLTFNLGKQKDSDLDGVSDKKDKCPNTPAGVAVDALGCPLDTDKDGIADYLDACPQMAGIESLKGCPDKDFDGITDKEDRCPDVAGSASLQGCPDTDMDGVADIDDKCSGSKPGYQVDASGCAIDNDKDGIVNEEDLCPDLAGPIVFNGCPDTDGDGVADNQDRCPTAKGTINNKGCPEIAKEDIVKITLIASKIYFETNSDKLKLISNSQLDDLALILKKYNEVTLTIEGHTDNVGEDAYNQELSQKRTESVKSYLISKGIAEERLNAKGFGETMPVADNKKEAGRAKNRRVELKTSY